MSRQRVGVLGNGREQLAATVESAGGDPVAGSPGGFDDVAVIVAAGERAFVDLARAGPDAPILPVDAGAGVRSVPWDRAQAATERVLAGEYSTERHPVLSAEGRSGGAVRAVLDVALVAAEQARISEFSVRWKEERVAQFRADGVVASTPAGSPGYNRAASGPLLAPGTGALAVVPIAPFATHEDRWVLPIEGTTVAVEREDPPVELLADGRLEATVDDGAPIALGHAADVRTVVVPEGEQFF